MNERIRELAKQCYETGPIGRDGWPEYSRLNETKFAELIIRECVNQAHGVADLRGANDDMIYGADTAAVRIHRFFGVEK